MFFRRRKKSEVDDVELDDALDPVDADDVDAGADEAAETAETDETDEDAATDDTAADDTAPDEPEDDEQPEGQTDWEALDEQPWRDEGPFDISEHDPFDDPVGRLDLGGIVVKGFDGMELRLQVAEETQEIVSVMMLKGGSALELAAFAAPRSGGFWSELRDEIVDAANQAGGSVGLVEGPFGTEVRRLLPVRTNQGTDGYQLTRMWAAQGPRWLLRGLVYGDAALAEDLTTPAVAELLEAFRGIVVRRGDAAMAPGDLIPLSFPKPLGEDDPASDAPDEDADDA